ncbi:MAG: TfoX/Sxy family protein [Thermodesulfobacteriota bacterium]
MAYDEKLCSRVRAQLATLQDVSERKMFGGIAFLLNGHMTCGILGDSLVLRLGHEGAAQALRKRHTRPMDFTGRALASMVYVDAAGCRREGDLRAWIDAAVRYSSMLPAKKPRQSMRSIVGGRQLPRVTSSVGK